MKPNSLLACNFWRKVAAGSQGSKHAANRKAARRTGDPACAFSSSIHVPGDDHGKFPLLASSVALGAGDEPLVPVDTPIPLGMFQVIRPAASVAMGVDLGVLRVRFTPARGLVYGPKDADSATDQETGRSHPIVLPPNQILNSKASWMQYTSDRRSDNLQPSTPRNHWLRKPWEKVVFWKQRGDSGNLEYCLTSQGAGIRASGRKRLNRRMISSPANAGCVRDAEPMGIHTKGEFY